MVYEPAEDSELLLESALKEIRPEDDVIEVGAGSGFVAERLVGKCRSIMVTDISPHAVRILREKGLDVVRTDIARGIKKKFSLVLFNPPYLELEDELKRDFWKDCAINGGKDGIEVICRFLDTLRDFMDKNGRAVVIISSLNLPRFFEEVRRRGFDYKVLAVRKLFFEQLYAIKIFERERDPACSR